MHPVERPLHIGKARRQPPNEIGIWRDSEAYAVDDSFQTYIWARKHVDICFHTRTNVLYLGFAKVRDRPPHTSVDQDKYLHSGVSVRTLRDGEIGDTRIERGDDFAVVEIVSSGIDRRPSSPKLPQK